MPKQDKGEQADQEIGNVVRQCGYQERGNGDCRGNAATREATYNHKATTEPAGGDGLISKKLD